MVEICHKIINKFFNKEDVLSYVDDNFFMFEYREKYS